MGSNHVWRLLIAENAFKLKIVISQNVEKTIINDVINLREESTSKNLWEARVSALTHSFHTFRSCLKAESPDIRVLFCFVFSCNDRVLLEVVH